MSCNNCGKDRPTSIWTDSAMSWVHGSYEQWCKVCQLEAQLQHACERSKAIPGLMEDLLEAKAEAVADDVLAGMKDDAPQDA